MGLKNMVSALLPRDYREQVFGDLEERGFRFADAASVLPRIWWSHLRRASRVPILTGASEAVLRNRAETFHRRRTSAVVAGLLAHVAFFFTYSGMFSDKSLAGWRSQKGGALAILALALLFFFIGAMAIHKLAKLTAPPSPTGREEWLSYHRKQLDAAFRESRWGGPAFMTQIWALGQLALQPGLTTLWIALVLIFAVVRFRGIRLRRELETLL